MTEKLYQLYAAYRHQQTPWYIKATLLLLLAYIISPIDIIPDFIPVLGLLDEVILIPFCLALVYRMMPKDILHEIDSEVIDDVTRKKFVLAGIGITICCWLIVIVIAVYALTII